MDENAAKSSHEKFCFECGALINSKAEICPKCGVRQMPPPAESTAPSRLIAALLALFLGGLGIHKFYLKRPRAGFWYLIFIWTGIPVLLGPLDAIVLLLMSNSSFRGKYGSQ